MHPKRHSSADWSALLATALLALALALPALAAAQSPPASLSLDDVPNELVAEMAPAENASTGTGEPDSAGTSEAASEAASAGEPQPLPAGPGLAEATGAALDTVFDAARRDGVSWVQRLHTSLDLIAHDARVAWQALLDSPVSATDRWLAAAGLPTSQSLLLPGAGVACALLALLVFLRGKGDLKVAIEYPAELRGTFGVRIARRPNAGRKGPRMTSPLAAERSKRRASTSSKTERHLVSREADFPRIVNGRWYVTVDGFLQPPDDETVIATHFEERELQVRRGRTVRVDIDLRPKEAPVDVKVLWDRKPAAEALIAWRDLPHSLRYARGGPVRMGAPRGDLTLVVGAGDRVAELPLQIHSFQPTTVEIDLADRDKLLFNGCPPAVEPYLHGDVAAAARALEREGQQSLSHLLLARLQQQQGNVESAARHYAEAERPAEAADLYRELGNYQTSAELYESAGKLVDAAEMYREAGDTLRAGAAYQTAREYQSAATCFEEAGEISKWCDALEKNGQPYEAARVALENGEEGRAIRSLQLLRPGDDDYVQAAQLLVEMLQREGHLDLAVSKIEELLSNRGADEVPIELCDKLASLLEENEQYPRAIDVLELIRRRDPAWPNLATRLEELRKLERTQQPTAEKQDAGDINDFGGVRYEILEEIGRGGMGIVFKARDRRLGRVVALKKLPDNLRNHPKAIELFLREARASAQLNHPNIVTVHDAGQQGDAFFIAMELMEGLPLHDILHRNGPLAPRDVAKIGVQVCKGLQYAHEHRIVHRDIKTANLFFTKAKTLKVMDFGLAKMLEEVRRASTVIGGTPYYMAPEQSIGGAVDGRADLYALGVTFYELLLGKVPFAEGDVAYHHRHTPPPDPRDSDPSIPAALAELVLQLMAKSPDDRPADAAEVTARLQKLLR
ncbi:MAG: protein kinase [Deltaproteobacteria bacterium]|nr:protein kinase [Deltaproteobacteria bacterium]